MERIKTPPSIARHMEKVLYSWELDRLEPPKLYVCRSGPALHSV